jgi:hypothetical protein
MVAATIPTTVTGIQGVPVSANAPAANQALGWNGTTWIPQGPFLPLAGGSLTGPVTLAAGSSAANIFQIQGVIDGSAGAAGVVGQNLATSGGPFGIANGTWASPCSISFPPGDWDVWGAVSFQMPVADVVQYLAGVGTNPNTFGTPLTAVVSGNGQGNSTIYAPRTAFRFTAQTIVYLNGYAFSNGGSASQISGSLQGRRRR